MKKGAIFVFTFLLLCPIPGLSQPSGVPTGLTPMPPVRCSGNQNLVIENRYIQTTGNAVEVGGNCDVEILNSHIVAGGYAVLVEYNGNAEVTGSTLDGGRAAIHATGNGEIYYEQSRVLGKIQTSQSGELEDGGSNSYGPSTQRAAEESGSPETSPRISLGESDEWRVQAEAVSYDLAVILEELGAVADGDRLRLHLAGDVLFDFDSDVIRPTAAVELAKVAHVLRRRAGGEIALEGHTDSVGTEEYNQTLSQARAEAVRRWLHEKEAVPLPLMTARGWGEKKPVAYNTMPDGSDYPEGRAKNRRVEISFQAGEFAMSAASGGVAITAGGVTLQSGAAKVQIGAQEPVELTEPAKPCAEICDRWSELDDTQIECVTGALILSGYAVYSSNACVGVDSTSHCKLCWQTLKVSAEDCSRVSRVCLGR